MTSQGQKNHHIIEFPKWYNHLFKLKITELFYSIIWMMHFLPKIIKTTVHGHSATFWAFPHIFKKFRFFFGLDEFYFCQNWLYWWFMNCLTHLTFYYCYHQLIFLNVYKMTKIKIISPLCLSLCCFASTIISENRSYLQWYFNIFKIFRAWFLVLAC